MSTWYAPETDSTYQRERPGSPDHIEIAPRPSPYHRYDRETDTWNPPPQEVVDRLAERRARREAEQNLRDRYAVSMRLTLWLVRYVWPRLDAAERAEVREIIPDEMEAEIETALKKLKIEKQL